MRTLVDRECILAAEYVSSRSQSVPNQTAAAAVPERIQSHQRAATESFRNQCVPQAQTFYHWGYTLHLIWLFHRTVSRILAPGRTNLLCSFAASSTATVVAKADKLRPAAQFGPDPSYWESTAHSRLHA